MDEIVKEFLLESNANFARLDTDLATLGKDPRSPVALESIYRTLHTLKGSAAFLSFAKLEVLAASTCQVVRKMQDGKLTLNVEIATALVKMVAAVRRVLGHIEKTEKEGGEELTGLIATFKQLALGPSPKR